MGDEDRATVQLSRGEAFVSRATYDRVGAAALAAVDGGNTHVYVVEPDGSITDTEAS